MRNKLTIAVGIAVSAVFLWWAFKGLSFAEMWHHARSANLLLIIASVAVTTATFVIRIFRWRLMLLTDDGGPVGRIPMWHAIAIGFMANNVLPLRAGEILRAVAISRLAPVRFTSALSSLVLERLFDAIAIIGLLFVGLVSAGIPPATKIGDIVVADIAIRLAVICGVLLAGCAVTIAWPQFVNRIISALIPNRAVAGRLIGIVESIRAGISTLASPTRILAVLAWSVGMWLFNAASFYLGYLAFGIEVGFGGAILQQSVLVLGIAAPSTPGYVGVFEGVIKAVLALFAVPGDLAVAFALTYHVTTFLPITLLGAYSALRTGMSLKPAAVPQ
ncbi:MAG: flippase-like domain-containing protein [Gemmatimonadetes bacterium]|nr:flippase-like domain-containing protein [Gemmatimonadota bacterium]